MEEKEYQKQIKGLIIILNEGNSDGNSPTIHRTYVIEKLNMILQGGIGFNALILEKLENDL